MKYLSYAMIILLLICACSDSSTGPDKHDNGSNVSQTIGAEGGAVETDTVTLTVPAGSFSADTAIGISETDEDKYEENAVSGTFLLSGIPEDFTAPLTLTVAYTGELAHETYLVVEESV